MCPNSNYSAASIVKVNSRDPFSRTPNIHPAWRGSAATWQRSAANFGSIGGGRDTEKRELPLSRLSSRHHGDGIDIRGGWCWLCCCGRQLQLFVISQGACARFPETGGNGDGAARGRRLWSCRTGGGLSFSLTFTVPHYASTWLKKVRSRSQLHNPDDQILQGSKLRWFIHSGELARYHVSENHSLGINHSCRLGESLSLDRTAYGEHKNGIKEMMASILYYSAYKPMISPYQK